MLWACIHLKNGSSVPWWCPFFLIKAAHWKYIAYITLRLSLADCPATWMAGKQFVDAAFYDCFWHQWPNDNFCDVTAVFLHAFLVMLWVGERSFWNRVHMTSNFLVQISAQSMACLSGLYLTICLPLPLYRDGGRNLRSDGSLQKLRQTEIVFMIRHYSR